MTGDAGFLLDGELYVLGRVAESVKVRGRTVYAESLELDIASELGIPTGRCVIISTQHTTSAVLVAVVERPAGEWGEEIGKLLRRQVGPGVQLQVYAAEPGVIPRTTSGKPRRRRMWQALTAGKVAAALVWESERRFAKSPT
jgi:fatty-acyl-CoA synthase